MRINFQTLLFLILTVALGAAAITAQKKPAKTKKPKVVKQQVDDLIRYEPDAELLAGLNERVQVVEADKDWARFDRQRPINNADSSRAAYIAKYPLKREGAEETPDTLYDVIVVHDAGSDKFYKLTGFDDFPWRDFSEIKWTSREVLEFEQWVNPNNGGRYAVNVKTGKVIRAGYVRSK